MLVRRAAHAPSLSLKRACVRMPLLHPHTAILFREPAWLDRGHHGNGDCTRSPAASQRRPAVCGQHHLCIPRHMPARRGQLATLRHHDTPPSPVPRRQVPPPTSTAYLTRPIVPNMSYYYPTDAMPTHADVLCPPSSPPLSPPLPPTPTSTLSIKPPPASPSPPPPPT